MSQLTVYHCRFCQGLIPTGRIDRVYCSKACKQKAYRWRNRIDRYTKEIEKNAKLIADYLDYDDTRVDALHALVKIQPYIVDITRQHGQVLKAVK